MEFGATLTAVLRTVTTFMQPPLRIDGHVLVAVVTGMNLIAILYVVVAGAPFGQSDNLTPFAPHGIPGIFAGAAIVYFSFVGFDTVATVAEEVRSSSRSIPPLACYTANPIAY